MTSLVTARVEHEVTFVELTGELDIWSAPEARPTFAEVLDRGAGGPRLAVDLRRLHFIDSTGIAVLVGAFKKARKRNGSMVLICTESQPLRALTRTGLTKVFQIYPSPEALFAANRST
jgi:anti-anti-sigma factor